MEAGQPSRPCEAGPNGDLILGLQPGQLEREARRPVPHRRLGARARTAMWLLRAFVLGVTGLVGYLFVESVIRST
jgi:hypothetical protein